MHASSTTGLESADPSGSIVDSWDDGQVDWVDAQAIEETLRRWEDIDGIPETAYAFDGQ